MRSNTAAHAEVERKVLGAFGEFGFGDEFVGFDVTAVASVVECRHFLCESHMHIDIRVGKAAIFAVDVEVGLHFDALRAHVREF